MFGQGKSKTERSCALSWFSNWSPEQKGSFLQRMGQKDSLDEVTDSLLADLERLSVSGGQRQQECPSVFECQLRIFDQWFRQWSEEDKKEFSEMLLQLHPEAGSAGLQISG